MGSRILSRSFRVEEWQISGGQLDAETVPSSEGMEVDPPVNLSNVDSSSQRSDTDSESEDDEDVEDQADVAMVPIADILNARYGSENVSFRQTYLAPNLVRDSIRQSYFTRSATFAWSQRGP